ncbi:MAG: acyl-CoA dehydrogenase, partial [Pseudonocardia sp.]|nr:acyl-CoA dehydrogenase [Pseudonocardia sp.]
MGSPSTALPERPDRYVFQADPGADPRADPDRFRTAVRDWLADALAGEFSGLRGAGGPGREHEAFDERLAWDRHLAEAGWTCLSWPVEHGGAGAPLAHQVIFHEEYARADAPARVNHFGEELLGPTLIAFGTPAQQQRFLPGIVAVRELWCQGYSEPGAGSDLAAVRTRATLDGEAWVIDGQKVWTSLAHVAHWCFLLAR